MLERSSRGRLGLMLAMLAMGEGISSPGSSSGSRDYEPKAGPPLTDPKMLHQMHRFVIGGKEVWGRNKKDAIKRAKAPLP